MIGRRLLVVRVCACVTMEEQQHDQAPPVKPEKKVTLQDLEEVDLLQKWTINLRILLEPISFLRYAVIVSTILHVQRPHIYRGLKVCRTIIVIMLLFSTFAVIVYARFFSHGWVQPVS